MKLQAKIKREEAEEAGRQLVDIEEAKYQAQKRKEAIEKAKTAQYFQTDSLKSFHVKFTMFLYVIILLKLKD